MPRCGDRGRAGGGVERRFDRRHRACPVAVRRRSCSFVAAPPQCASPSPLVQWRIFSALDISHFRERRRIGALARAGDRRGRDGEGEPRLEPLDARPRGAPAPSAPSRSIAASSEDMKLSPAPTVSTTSTLGAATLVRRPPRKATAPRSPSVATQKLGPSRAHRLSVSSIGAAGIEPFEVLLARLDDAGERNLPLDQRDHAVAIRRHQRADVRVVARRRPLARQAQRRDDALAVARIDGGDRADMQMPGALGPGRRERPAAVERGRVEIKGIARSRLRGAAHDEGERRRPGVARDQAEIDAVARRAPRRGFRRWRRPKFATRTPSARRAGRARSRHYRASRRAPRRSGGPCRGRG